jgi:dipeptidyl-peptidase-3
MEDGTPWLCSVESLQKSWGPFLNIVRRFFAIWATSMYVTITVLTGSTNQNQGEGDQKFVPGVTAEALRKIASITPQTEASLEKIIDSLLAVPPFGLGYPSKNAQSGYYPSEEHITEDDIAKVSKLMVENSIGPENTRLRKVYQNHGYVLHLLQASAETGPSDDGSYELADGVFLSRGDHSREMAKVCTALEKAKAYTCNERQAEVLTRYIECFRTGNLEAFQDSQKLWVKDVSARVENILGFIEPYRDPAGIRSEWEAMVGIADAIENKKLRDFVDRSAVFIRQLPWAVEGVNDGKGPFEKRAFEAPDFTSLHGKLSSHT